MSENTTKLNGDFSKTEPHEMCVGYNNEMCVGYLWEIT